MKDEKTQISHTEKLLKLKKFLIDHQRFMDGNDPIKCHVVDSGSLWSWIDIDGVRVAIISDEISITLNNNFDFNIDDFFAKIKMYCVELSQRKLRAKKK